MFELTHEQKRFRGDPENKDDIAAHRKRLAELLAKQAAKKREWQAKLEEAREKDAKASGHQDLVKAQRALKSAQAMVAVSRTAVATAEQALKEAVKAVHKCVP